MIHFLPTQAFLKRRLRLVAWRSTTVTTLLQKSSLKLAKSQVHTWTVKIKLWTFLHHNSVKLHQGGEWQWENSMSESHQRYASLIFHRYADTGDRTEIIARDGCKPIYDFEANILLVHYAIHFALLISFKSVS